MQRNYKLRDIEERIELLGGLNVKKGGKDYVFDFHGESVYFFVTHDKEVPDHGIKQIATGILNIYSKLNPGLDSKSKAALFDNLKDDLKGRKESVKDTVEFKELGSALETLGADVKYIQNKAVARLGQDELVFYADPAGEVHKYELNKVAKKVANFYHVDINDVMEHLPKYKKRRSGLESLLAKVAVVLAAFSLFSAVVWTGASYTGASTIGVSYDVGYYGIIALLLSFYALVMFFHKLHYD